MPPSARLPTIVVTGDLTADWHIALARRGDGRGNSPHAAAAPWPERLRAAIRISQVSTPRTSERLAAAEKFA